MEVTLLRYVVNLYVYKPRTQSNSKSATPLSAPYILPTWTSSLGPKLDSIRTKISPLICLRFRIQRLWFSLIKLWTVTKCSWKQVVFRQADPITRDEVMEFLFVPTTRYVPPLRIARVKIKNLFIVAVYRVSNVSVRLYWWNGCCFIKTPRWCCT